MSKKMPHNNRISGSKALATNDMWSNVIGHDPYASASLSSSSSLTNEQAAGVLLLAKMSNVSGDVSRGGCQRCGNIGHLTFQCRNKIAPPKRDDSDDDDSSTSSSSSSSSSDHGHSTSVRNDGLDVAIVISNPSPVQVGKKREREVIVNREQKESKKRKKAKKNKKSEKKAKKAEKKAKKTEKKEKKSKKSC